MGINLNWLLKLLDSDRYCPFCDLPRTAQTISFVDQQQSPYLNLTFQELGIPPGEILTMVSEETILFFEF